MNPSDGMCMVGMRLSYSHPLKLWHMTGGNLLSNHDDVDHDDVDHDDVAHDDNDQSN